VTHAVDATYKADLRELNELSFARFDAKVEQRTAETNARMDAAFGALDKKMDVGFARVDQRFAELRAEMLKWMFLFWTATMLTILFW
jgi:hypothetical protein